MPTEVLPSKTSVNPILAYLEQLRDSFADLSEGEIATYIPELGTADPDWFGISIATVDGHVYHIGDVGQEFTIQSISKPLTYAYALEYFGKSEVLKRVGTEPSGEAFNSISLEPGTGRPLNPMINAGAIATASFVPGESGDDRLEALLGWFSEIAGRELSVDESVYRSESETGHRNRAIAHLLRNTDILTDDPENTLDLYFKQCSFSVNCTDLAVMASCLAAGGIQPKTGKRVMGEETVRGVLSIMSTCGMYDFAGGWTFDIGMPAKSGVAGGIMAVLPGQLGIGVFSPRLDTKGNSVRGIEVCRALSEEFGLHVFNAKRVDSSALGSVHSGDSYHSSRQRRVAEQELLGRVGSRIKIFNLRGHMLLASSEMAMRSILAEAADCSHVLLNFEKVSDMDRASCRLMLELQEAVLARGASLHFVGYHSIGAFVAFLSEVSGSIDESLDEALERCEDALIVEAGFDLDHDCETCLAEQELCADLTSEQVAQLEDLLEARTWTEGEELMRHGSTADSLIFLSSGEVGVFLPRPSGEEVLALRLRAKSCVGELGLSDRHPRSGTVRALSITSGYVLSFAVFDAMEEKGLGEIKQTLHRNLLKVLAARLRIANREIGALR